MPEHESVAGEGVEGWQQWGHDDQGEEGVTRR
jgi:hypothetical protein